MPGEARNTDKRINSLILDAGPLITQTASFLQQFAQFFYTTPGVHGELKDENSRRQLIIWGDKLQIRQPKPEYIQKVVNFSKLTGDYAVLSTNDLHVIALAYELEVELNNGDWRLRKYPGEALQAKKQAKSLTEGKKQEDTQPKEPKDIEEDKSKLVGKKSELDEGLQTETPKKPRRRGGKKHREKREAQKKRNLESSNDTNGDRQVPLDIEVRHLDNAEAPETNVVLEEEYEESDDDGEWITPETLHDEMVKDATENVEETTRAAPFIKAALATGDFACQNVAMQIGINLMNYVSGKRIKRVRNYMFRCHACFRLTPIPKDGKPKHFCPKCGGNTLLRCAVSVDNSTGKVTPHLKANFQWIRRGERYSLPSPLSKNQQRRQGNAGYQHNKQNRHKTLQDPLILREDQKDYYQAIKNDDWHRRQNEKLLQEWVGGESADNYISPFTSSYNMKNSAVRVGSGRYINSSKGRRK